MNESLLTDNSVILTEPCYYDEMGKDGIIRRYNIESGELISQSRPGDAGLDIKPIPTLPGGQPIIKQIKFSDRTAIFMLQLLISGKTLTDICLMPGMPSYTILAKWRAENAQFDEALTIAYSMKAEGYVDKLEGLTMEADGTVSKPIDKESVPGMKLIVDNLKYLAAMRNPLKFGPRQQKDQETTRPVKIVINTGVTRRNPEEIQAELDREKKLKEIEE